MSKTERAFVLPVELAMKHMTVTGRSWTYDPSDEFDFGDPEFFGNQTGERNDWEEIEYFNASWDIFFKVVRCVGKHLTVERAVWQTVGTRGFLRRTRAQQNPRWVTIYGGVDVSNEALFAAMNKYMYGTFRGEMKIEA